MQSSQKLIPPLSVHFRCHSDTFTKNKICLCRQRLACRCSQQCRRHYNVLNTSIIKRTGHWDEQMLRELFNNIDIGERIYSQLHWRRKCHLRANNISILHRLCGDKLPATIIQTLTLMTHEKRADIADKMFVSFD